MNRRGFMKRCGLLPFAGALATLEQSATSESKPVAPLKIFNGQVFEAPWPVCHQVIVQYFGSGDDYILLSIPYRTSYSDWSTAMMVCRYTRKDGSYNPIYTQGELQEKLKDWKLVKSKIILDERDYEQA